MYNEEGMNIMASIYITGHPDDLEQQSEIIDQLAQEELFDAIRYENEAEVPMEELKVCDKQSTPCSKELALPEWRG